MLLRLAHVPGNFEGARFFPCRWEIPGVEKNPFRTAAHVIGNRQPCQPMILGL